MFDVCWEEGERMRAGVLELWNSRSSWRSVWPRSPWWVLDLCGPANKMKLVKQIQVDNTVPLGRRLRSRRSLYSPWRGLLAALARRSLGELQRPDCA